MKKVTNVLTSMLVACLAKMIGKLLKVVNCCHCLGQLLCFHLFLGSYVCKGACKDTWSKVKKAHISPLPALQESPRLQPHCLHCWAVLSLDPDLSYVLHVSPLFVAKYLAFGIKVVPQIKKRISSGKALLKDFFKVELCCLVVSYFTEVPPWNTTLNICQ